MASSREGRTRHEKVAQRLQVLLRRHVLLVVLAHEVGDACVQDSLHDHLLLEQLTNQPDVAQRRQLHLRRRGRRKTRRGQRNSAANLKRVAGLKERCVATVSKSKELKKRYGAKRELTRQL